MIGAVDYLRKNAFITQYSSFASRVSCFAGVGIKSGAFMFKRSRPKVRIGTKKKQLAKSRGQKAKGEGKTLI
jgi:hypothetical protein